MSPEDDARVAALESTVVGLAAGLAEMTQVMTAVVDQVYGADPVTTRWQMYQRRADAAGRG